MQQAQDSNKQAQASNKVGQPPYLLVQLQDDRLVGVVAVPLRQRVHIRALRKLRRQPLDLRIAPRQCLLRQSEQRWG